MQTVQIALRRSRPGEMPRSLSPSFTRSMRASELLEGADVRALMPTRHDQDAPDAALEAAVVELVGEEHRRGHAQDVGVRGVVQVGLTGGVRGRVGARGGGQDQDLRPVACDGASRSRA